MTRSGRPTRSTLGLVIERMVSDQHFRARLTSDPPTALAAYPLSELEVDLLVEMLDDEQAPAADEAKLPDLLERFVADGGLAALGIQAGLTPAVQRAS